ncbi:aromatic prenyltransferase [Clathrospora elynae]|uniref:Aromatic prenyltransferase n=1 Tax=Clathrospora elynae TaxID=706981 RepID=A0A6A5SEV4_9PLEO|nr:aromatic prenyltransferase [Clathrospora elynae]
MSLNGGVTNRVERRSKHEASAASQFTSSALDALLQDASIASQPPYQVMQSLLSFDNTSKFWWDVTASTLSKLMTKASYPLSLHYKNLAFCYDAVLQGYGPIPSRTEDRGWNATVTQDGSPFEPSWTFKTSGSPEESVIRFTIEANSAETASVTDPLFQKATESLVTRAEAAGASFDLTIYEYFKKELFFDDDEGVRLRREYPDSMAPQSYFAFDFEKDGQILGKGFFFFIWKSRATGQSSRVVAQNLIASTPVIGPLFKEALGAWDRCLTTFPAEFGGEPRVECMGFDLLRPSKSSRIKVYTRLVNSSFNAVTHLYTLGGVLQDPTTLKGLELLKLFWHVVCGVEDGPDFGDQEVPVLHEGWADTILNWEFKPGELLPRPKLYMPLWKWLPSEFVICERLSEYWRRMGWDQQAESYTQDWQEIFPWLDGTGFGGMNYVSFAYKDDGSGLYMTLYFSPKAYDTAEKLEAV